MTNQRQLELGFDGSPVFQPLRSPQHRLGRAQWWFEQMRKVVNRAFDWQPAPPFRPEQPWLALSANPQRG